MRRKDRQMNEDFGLGVVDKAAFGVLSLVEKQGCAYGMPLSMARDEKKLYFHSATSGRKVAGFQEGMQVHVVFVGEHHVPSVFREEELQELVKKRDAAMQLTSKVFTTEYESAMVEGVLRFITEKEEKRHGLKVICQKFTPERMDLFPFAMEKSLDLVNVYAVEIREITAKRKKFDLHGEEMKWQRMKT